MVDQARRKTDPKVADTSPAEAKATSQDDIVEATQKHQRALLNQLLIKTNALDVAQKNLDAANKLILELTIKAYFDPLTGLPNRSLLEESFVEATQGNEPLVVVCIDLNRFKPINDNYGHAVGDQALKLVANTLFQHTVSEADLKLFANTLSSLTRPTDVITLLPARHGGDEFVILLKGATLDVLQNKLLELRQAFKTQVLELGPEHGHQKIQVGASIGAYQYEQGDTLKHCLKMADEAMYAEKEANRRSTSYSSFGNKEYYASIAVNAPPSSLSAIPVIDFHPN